MNELALFAGAGGGILGGHILGWRTVCAVEWEPYAASVLAARQNDGLLPPFPIWDDVQSFDGRPWRGSVDVVSGGFPCQDISVAGKGAGIDGARSGMWSHMARIVGEVRPRYVFVENSPALLTRGLSRVLGDLAALGYDCRWTVLGAADVGAPHQRDRFWLVAHSTGAGRDARRLQDGGINQCSSKSRPSTEPSKPSSTPPSMAHANSIGQSRQQRETGSRQADATGGCSALCHSNRQGLEVRQGQQRDDGAQLQALERADWWQPEPRLGRGTDGLAARLDQPWQAGWEDGIPRVAPGITARVDRLKAIGNGQVPLCAATAWRLLK